MFGFGSKSLISSPGAHDAVFRREMLNFRLCLGDRKVLRELRAQGPLMNAQDTAGPTMAPQHVDSPRRFARVASRCLPEPCGCAEAWTCPEPFGSSWNDVDDDVHEGAHAVFRDVGAAASAAAVRASAKRAARSCFLLLLPMPTATVRRSRHRASARRSGRPAMHILKWTP